MKKLILLISAVSMAVVSGCAQVPLAPPAEDMEAKQFKSVPDKSVIYVYRNESFGGAIPMSVSLNGKFMGKTGPQSYFRWVVKPGKHIITSEAENTEVFSLGTVKNKIYCLWQEVKMGFLFARNKLQRVDDANCRKGVMESKLISKDAAKIQKSEDEKANKKAENEF